MVKTQVIQVLVLYLLIINVAGLLVMAIDKHRARRRAWRISEATLFAIALFGGSIGCLGGMYLFHHKTMKPAFQYGMPAILIAQVVILLIVFFLLPYNFRIM